MKRVKVLLISVLLLSILSINLADTYGLFETKAKAETIMSVGKWNVTLNDTDITLKQKVSFDDFVFTGSPHTEEGYLAPGSTGTFDLNIDVSECDTSVEYNLSFDTTKFEEHPNIELKILDEDTNEEVSDGVLTGVIKLSDPNKVKNIKIKIIWNDVEEYNESDSKLIGESLDIVINSNFRQYTGE